MAFKPITYNTPPEQEAHILAEDDAAIYEGLMGKDCVFSIGEQLKASVISNNKVRLSDGVVSVGGHIGRILKGDYEDMTIANGVSGRKRNDIIAARYITGGSGGADSYKLVVVQGTAGTEAVDPVLVKGDLYGGDKQRDYPLYRVQIDGISIVKVEQMFEMIPTISEVNQYLLGSRKIMLAKKDGISVGTNTQTFEIEYNCPSHPIAIIPHAHGGAPFMCSVNSWTDKQAVISVEAKQNLANRTVVIAIIY